MLLGRYFDRIRTYVVCVKKKLTKSNYFILAKMQIYIHIYMYVCIYIYLLILIYLKEQSFKANNYGSII